MSPENIIWILTGFLSSIVAIRLLKAKELGFKAYIACALLAILGPVMTLVAFLWGICWLVSED